MKTDVSPFRPHWVIASMVFFAMAAWEARFDLGGVVRAGFLPAANQVGWVLVPMWILAGALLLMMRSIAWRPYLVAAGMIASLMHGAFLRVGRTNGPGPSGGSLYILAALLWSCCSCRPFVNGWLSVDWFRVALRGSLDSLSL